MIEPEPGRFHAFVVERILDLAEIENETSTEDLKPIEIIGDRAVTIMRPITLLSAPLKLVA